MTWSKLFALNLGLKNTLKNACSNTTFQKVEKKLIYQISQKTLNTLGDTDEGTENKK